MRFQEVPYGCGAAAICNALEAIGISRSEAKVRADAGTTAEAGAGPNGIKQALERAEAPCSEINESFEDAYQHLMGHLMRGGSAILLTEAGDHWETAVGTLGHRVVIFNPDRAKFNRAKAINGVYVLTKRQLKNYWDAFEGKRYAVLVGPMP